MEAIGGPTAELATEEGGGLTVEEMELEQQLLQVKFLKVDSNLLRVWPCDLVIGLIIERSPVCFNTRYFLCILSD